MQYTTSKGLSRGHQDRTDSEKAIGHKDFIKLLKCVESTADLNRFWRRDQCAIYLGYMLAMSVGETVLLAKSNTTDLETTGQIHLPTLKPKRGVRAVDVDDDGIAAYIADFKWNHMRGDQEFFFEGRNAGEHISASHLSRIFSSYLFAAELPLKLSFDCLRHGRARQLWHTFKDVAVLQANTRVSPERAFALYARMDDETKFACKKALSRKTFVPGKMVIHAKPSRQATT